MDKIDKIGVVVNILIVMILRITLVRPAANLDEGLANALADVATLADVICKRHDRERNNCSAKDTCGRNRPP